MGLSYKTGNYAPEFNSVYKITLDMSGWDRTTIQFVAPMSGKVYVYGTNDAGALQGVRYGNASLATNFNPIQATSLATGTAANTITAAGDYRVDVNAQFLRLQGSPAAAGTNIYGIQLFHSKIS